MPGGKSRYRRSSGFLYETNESGTAKGMSFRLLCMETEVFYFYNHLLEATNHA